MIQKSPDAATSKREYELKLRHARALAGLAAFKNPLVWAANLAQIGGFILIFFVFFPDAQPRLVLILAYALPTMFLVRQVHNRVTQRILDARASNSEPA
jgi:hypothetical protein